jgi:hypothetical protein
LTLCSDYANMQTSKMEGKVVAWELEVVKWVRAHRDSETTDRVITVLTITDDDPRATAIQALMAMSFEAGRTCQHNNPEASLDYPFGA